MSIFGSSLAGALAQGTLSAADSSRRLTRDQTQASQSAKRVRDMMEAHLRTLEEGDQASPDRVYIESQLPDHEQQPQTPQREKHEAADVSTDEESQALSRIMSASLLPELARKLPAFAKSNPPDQAPLYQHIDIQA